MKLHLITFTFLIICCLSSNAQNGLEIHIDPKGKPLDIRMPIIKAIAYNFNSELLHKTPKDQPYIISIALAFNEAGKIDTVFFSNNISKRTLETIRPNNELVSKIKSIGLVSKDYKSKIVLFPILFKRMEDKGIDYQSGFLSNYENLWPDFGPFEKRPLILLKPYINSYHKSH